jgi:hypothetical protein
LEKREEKDCILRMQGDPESGDPLGLGGEWGFIAYLHCLKVEMPFRCKQAFPREEKCLLDHLSPFWDFPQSVLQSFMLSPAFLAILALCSYIPYSPHTLLHSLSLLCNLPHFAFSFW